MINPYKIEFNLTVKKYRDKNKPEDPYQPYPMREDGKIELEVYETLDFKGLSAVEVMRKLLDYIQE